MKFKAPETMEIYKQMQMVLKSSANPDSKQGSSSEIIHVLKNPLKFPSKTHAVGLVSLAYTPNKNTTQQVLQENPLEENRPEENRIVKKRKRIQTLLERSLLPDPVFPGYVPLSKEEHNFEKQDDHIFNFAKRFNSDIGNHIDVLITLFPADIKDKYVASISFTSTNPKQLFVISESLAHLLKFDRLQFTPGLYIARDSVTQTEFNKYSMGYEFETSIQEINYIQSLAQVEQCFQSLLLLYKGTQTILDFLANIQARLQLLGFEIIFTLTQDSKTSLAIKGTAAHSACEQLTLSSNLCSILGFSNDVFKPGVHLSQFPFSLDHYNRLDPMEEMFCRVDVMQLLPIFITKPENNKVETVLGVINKAFKDNKFNDYQVEYYYSKGDIVLHNNTPKGTEIILPKLLNIYFGIPEDSIFLGGTRFPTGKEIVEQEEQIEYKERGEDWIPPAHGQVKKMLIISDIVKPQQYGSNSSIPLLREVTLSQDDKKQCEIIFDPVIYLTTTGEQLSEIRVEFKDETFQPIVFEKETSVTLHFKALY